MDININRYWAMDAIIRRESKSVSSDEHEFKIPYVPSRKVRCSTHCHNFSVTFKSPEPLSSSQLSFKECLDDYGSYFLQFYFLFPLICNHLAEARLASLLISTGH